jgi:hypothetical protein
MDHYALLNYGICLIKKVFFKKQKHRDIGGTISNLFKSLDVFSPWAERQNVVFIEWHQKTGSGESKSMASDKKVSSAARHVLFVSHFVFYSIKTTCFLSF